MDVMEIAPNLIGSLDMSRDDEKLQVVLESCSNFLRETKLGLPEHQPRLVRRPRPAWAGIAGSPMTLDRLGICQPLHAPPGRLGRTPGDHDGL